MRSEHLDDLMEGAQDDGRERMRWLSPTSTARCWEPVQVPGMSRWPYCTETGRHNTHRYRTKETL